MLVPPVLATFRNLEGWASGVLLLFVVAPIALVWLVVALLRQLRYDYEGSGAHALAMLSPILALLPHFFPILYLFERLGDIAFSCFISAAGVGAVVCGFVALAKMPKEVAGQPKGRAIAGIVLGYLVLAFAISVVITASREADLPGLVVAVCVAISSVAVIGVPVYALVRWLKRRKP